MPEPSWTAEPGTSRTLEENWLFRLRRERFRSRISGKSHDYFIMDLADAVNVVALTKDRQVVLVRQFRAGSNSDSLEPPGGLLEAGEDPRDAGARELLEETGYAGSPAVVLGSSWSNPSILGSRITTILIEDARRVREPKPDDSEEVAVELHPADSILPMIRAGAIDHAPGRGRAAALVDTRAVAPSSSRPMTEAHRLPEREGRLGGDDEQRAEPRPRRVRIGLRPLAREVEHLGRVVGLRRQSWGQDAAERLVDEVEADPVAPGDGLGAVEPGEMLPLPFLEDLGIEDAAEALKLDDG